MRPAPAHPRVGGENPRRAEPAPFAAGSSPRGRGKPAGHPLCPVGVGLIPAWAGKTRRERRIIGGHQAHPRVGGENTHECGSLVHREGSSPRGRGKQSRNGLHARQCGLIPAWAGKTALDVDPTDVDEAHPRVGGENQGDRIFDRSDNGSSPRGRGKPGVVDRDLNPIRLIPAWAGKTRLPRLRSRRRRAHPRVGGENSWSPTRARIVTGSSPRGRGKPATRARIQLYRRLIPAWAGKTSGDLG